MLPTYRYLSISLALRPASPRFDGLIGSRFRLNDSALIATWISVFALEFVLMGSGVALIKSSLSFTVLSLLFPFTTIMASLYVSTH
jgi:hypothetical protein